MRVWTRPVLAVAAVLPLVGAVGCSALGGEEGPPPAPKDGLASVDPCKVLTPQAREPYGIPDAGEPVTDLPWQPSCMYQNRNFGVTVYKDTKFTVDALHGQAQWAKWDPVNLNGRPGVTAVNSGETKSRLCETMFDSGRGRISIQFHMNHPGDESYCEKSQEIAKQIAPAMPPKQ